MMMMKVVAVLFLSAFLTTGASAQFIGPSASEKVATVEQLQAARRGQNVSLKGFVVKHLRDRYYLFRDSTGEIRLRIDRHVWRNRRVTSKDPIRLVGKIDRDFRELYVNVTRLEVLE